MITLTFRYRFFLQIFVRVVLITLNCLLLAYVWAESDWFFTLVNLGALIVLQVILLIYYLNKMNSDMMHFLASIRSEDANLTFARKWKSFSDLYGLMEEINGRIQALRSEYAAQVRYFSTVVEYVQTGLISFGQDGQVELMNRAAKQILGIRAVGDLETIPFQDGSLRTFFSKLEPCRNKLIRLTCGMEQVFLSVHCTMLGLKKEKLKIISFQNIRSELDVNESESWQRLIRVLNHEIMNSVAPVLSTVTTLNAYFAEGSGNPLVSDGKVNEVIYRKTVTGLELIRDRSEGLRQFVEKYKNLYHIEGPEYAIFQVKDLFNSCLLLLRERLEAEGIALSIVTSRNDLQMVADRKLFQQVIINLVKNAVEALSGSDVTDKKIEMKAFTDNHNKHIIQVSDNGPGIPEEIADQVFIPFYSTKIHGSGIGLSLSRMILARMGWSVQMSSKPFLRTTFTLSD